MKNVVKRNENGMIDLFLCRDFGSNMLKVAEFSNLKDLKKAGKKLLASNAECSNNLPAREFAYLTKDGLIFHF